MGTTIRRARLRQMEKAVDFAGDMPQSQQPYGTETHRRTDAPGDTPVELRRACVPIPVVPARSCGAAIATGHCRERQSRRALLIVELLLEPAHLLTALAARGVCLPGPEPLVAP